MMNAKLFCLATQSTSMVIAFKRHAPNALPAFRIWSCRTTSPKMRLLAFFNFCKICSATRLTTYFAVSRNWHFADNARNFLSNLFTVSPFQKANRRTKTLVFQHLARFYVELSVTGFTGNYGPGFWATRFNARKTFIPYRPSACGAASRTEFTVSISLKSLSTTWADFLVFVVFHDDILSEISLDPTYHATAVRRVANAQPALLGAS